MALHLIVDILQFVTLMCPSSVMLTRIAGPSKIPRHKDGGITGLHAATIVDKGWSAGGWGLSRTWWSTDCPRLLHGNRFMRPASSPFVFRR